LVTSRDGIEIKNLKELLGNEFQIMGMGQLRRFKGHRLGGISPRQNSFCVKSSIQNVVK